MLSKKNRVSTNAHVFFSLEGIFKIYILLPHNLILIVSSVQLLDRYQIRFGERIWSIRFTPLTRNT